MSPSHKAPPLSFQRRKQHPPHGIADRAAISGLKRLSGEFPVGIAEHSGTVEDNKLIDNFVSL